MNIHLLGFFEDKEKYRLLKTWIGGRPLNFITKSLFISLVVSYFQKTELQVVLWRMCARLERTANFYPMKTTGTGNYNITGFFYSRETRQRPDNTLLSFTVLFVNLYLSKNFITTSFEYFF